MAVTWSDGVHAERASGRASPHPVTRWCSTPLFPADPAARGRAEEAERWGEEQLQPIPRRLFRYGLARNPQLRKWVRADLEALPALLDHVDRLLDDGTLTLDPANAATLQIMATVNLMDRFADLGALLASHACAEPARELFPRYRAELPPFLEREWLESVRTATSA